MDKNNLTRMVSFTPSEFSPIGHGEKPGSIIYMNNYTEEMILEQLILEVESDTYKVRPSYAYFICSSDATPNLYIGSSMYRSVFNPVNMKTNEKIDLNIPIRFANPVSNN